MTDHQWADGIKRLSYSCTPQCKFWTYNQSAYMKHLAKCEHVGRWISQWAARMTARNSYGAPHRG